MIAFTETGGCPVTLAQLESACNEYEIESAALEKQIDKLDADLAEVKRRHMAALKRQAGVVANREAHLRGLVEGAQELFKQPRTLVIGGVKIGFTESAGAIAFDDENQVVELIKANLPKRFAELVKTEYSVRKNALKNLTDDLRAQIGCRIDGAGDTVIVKRTAGDVEKLINKLIAKLAEAIVDGD
jgi:hypothetical protein